MKQELLVEHLHSGYGGLEIVHDIHFAVESGQVVCILGPNGCGKSTLLKALLRFIPLYSGQVLLDGQNTATMERVAFSRAFSYSPQSDRMAFPYTVLEMVLMGRSNQISKWKMPSQEDRDYAYNMLEKLRIANIAQHLYTTLSGGQRQLVLIARAMCQNAQFIIMDEPTASLDFANQQLIMEVIAAMAKEGRCVMMTTHSPSQPFTIAHRVLLLAQGKMVAFGVPQEVLTSQTLEQVYGIPMDILCVKDRYAHERRVCLPVHQQEVVGA